MKKLLSLIIIGLVSTSIICKDTPQAIWREIKSFENSLLRKIYGFDVQGSWDEYHNNTRQKDNLFAALSYAEKQCDDKKFGARDECQEILLQPLLISYIDSAITNSEYALRNYFSAEDQIQYNEYISYLKEQKKHFTMKPIQAIREC